MRRAIGSITFEGFKIVPFAEGSTRQATRVTRTYHAFGVLQKNGNVAVSGITISPDMRVQSQLRLATLLKGLKLITSEMLQRYHDAAQLNETRGELAGLESRAGPHRLQACSLEESQAGLTFGNNYQRG